MRNSQLSTEMRFRRSLTRFFLLILAAVVLSVVTQVLLTSLRLEERVTQELSKLEPSYRVASEGVGFRFRSGLLPVIGIGVDRLEASPRLCPDQQMVLHEVLIPFRLSALVFGGARIGEVKVGLLEGQWAPCLTHPNPDQASFQAEDQTASLSAATQATKPSQSSVARKVSHLHSLVQTQASELPDQIRSRIQGLRVKRGLVKLKLGRHHLRSEFVLQIKARARLEAELRVHSVLLDDHDLPSQSAVLELGVEPRGADLKLRVPVREGQVLAQVMLPTTLSEAVPELSLQFKRLPLSHLSQVLLKETPLSYLWWDCDLKLKTTWERLATDRWQVQMCRVDGPYGQIELTDFDLNLERLQTVSFRVDKLELDQVVNNKRAAYLSGVLSRYGVLQTEGRFHKGELDLIGEVSGTEVLFSQLNRRDIQKISKANFRWKGSPQRWQGFVDKVSLQEGDWRGLLRAQKLGATDEIQVNLEAERLVFHPNIYKLVLRSEPSVLSLYGQGVWRKGKAVEWSVVAATPQIQGKGYLLNQVKVKGGRPSGGVPELDLSIATGELSAGSDLVNWLQGTTLQSKWSEAKLGFREMSVRLRVQENRSLEWRRGYVRLENGWQFSSEGQRDPSRNLTAWAQWDRPDRQVLRWSFTGSLFEGEWAPETDWVKEWLANNQGYLREQSRIRLEDVTKGS